MQPATGTRSLGAALLGRPFVHSGLEYLLVGGGLSIAATLFLWLAPEQRPATYTGLALATVLLASNSAHFAASTVRLYSKPGSFTAWPFLTMAFPLVSLAVLAVCVAIPLRLGTHLQSLYLTWSPYHYALQAYGIAVVYSHRSGCHLVPGDKRLLLAAALLPFVYACITAPGAGVFWFFTKDQVQSVPPVASSLRALARVLPWLGMAAPLLVFAKVWRSRSGPMPLLAPLALIANGFWWFSLTAMQAFFWATVFHGLQYLVIAVIFHVREQRQRPGNRRGAAYHALWFYGASLGLGYALFHALPRAFTLAGFGLVESMLLVIAAINVHHFIVDAYIWKLRPGDSNRRVVEAGAPASGPTSVPAPAPA
jgi:hypothetical protein